MDYFKTKINFYIEVNKKKSKLNNTQIGEVVILLKTVLCEDSSVIDEVINVLGELHYTTTAEFFRTAFVDLDEQVKNDFIAKFLSADKIVKNLNNFGITRNLVIINELLQTTGNDEYIHIILKACVKKAYGKDGGQKAGDLLSKICFDHTKDKIFALDYSTWLEDELRNFTVWIDRAIQIKKDTSVSATYKAFIEKYNLPKNNEADVEAHAVSKSDSNSDSNTEPTLKTETDNIIPQKIPKERIVVLVSALQSEVNKIINERSQLSNEIEEAKGKLEQANKDKENLYIQLSEARKINDQLHGEISIKTFQINDAEKKIAEMDERLKNAFKADKSQQNHELTSLKNDLVKRLKLQYLDYKKLAAKEYAPHYYEGLKEVIEDIFDTLRRKGIIVNDEN